MKSALALASLLLVGAWSARAQNVLLNVSDDGIAPIQVARGLVPFAQVGGELKSVRSGRLLFHRAPLFHDGLVQIDELHMSTYALEGGGKLFNVQLTLEGYITSSVPLDNCFFAFEMKDAKGATRQIGIIEAGSLKANDRQRFRSVLRVASQPEPGRYRLHVFCDRLECRQGRMGLALSSGLTTASDLAATAARDPRPFLAVGPDYPKALVSEAAAGQAVVSCRVGPEGDVLAAEVTSASRPEFGVAARSAARQWLFLPAIKDHRYVEEQIAIPFTFKAPAPPSA